MPSVIRMLLPYVAGLLLGAIVPSMPAGMSVGACVVAWALLCAMAWQGRYAFRHAFGYLLFVSFVLLGMACMQHRQRVVHHEWAKDMQVYQGVLLQVPKAKMRSMECLLRVQGRKVLLYVPADSLPRQCEIGDVWWIRTRMQAPHDLPGNPGFSYSRWLRHRGISGTGFASSVRHAGIRAPFSIRQFASLQRQRVLRGLRNWGFSHRNFPIVTALTVGYTDQIDPSLRRQYAVSGIAHVLALSGLHVGILWGIVWVLLCPLRRLRPWACMVALWAFAFLAGLTPSVVRAVIMCTVAECARLLNREMFTYNGVAIAAFLLLLYNPFYIYDVGFQLSFVAVLSILALYPLLHVPAMDGVWRGFRWAWGVMAVSLAAQVGTAPLVMYHFHYFSSYFLLANVCAAILLPCILGMLAVDVLVCWWPMARRWVSSLADAMVSLLNNLVASISHWPHASLPMAEVGLADLLGIYAVLAMTVCWIRHPRRRKVRMAWLVVLVLSLLVAWLGS